VAVAKSVRILHDPIHGVSSGLPSRILGNDVATIRGEINPSFGGVNPETIAENLGASIGGDERRLRPRHLQRRRRRPPRHPRRKGAFVSPQKIIALLALYLVREKK